MTIENETKVERTSTRELTVTRTFQAPVALVFEAWSKAELFWQWWIPKSFPITVISCAMDVRTGGTYRMVFGHPSSDKPMEFFGRYIDVVPLKCIQWTNEEGGEGAGAVTTATFEEIGGVTKVVLRDLYPTKEALDEAIASQATSCFPEQFDQLAELLS